MTYLLALIAAISYGTNWVLQQREANRAPVGLQLHPVRLLEYVIRRPLWLLGLLALAIGSSAQEGALVDGNLPVIETLLVLSLVWALVLANKLSHRRVTATQWLGAATVCVGLAAFLIAGNPTPGHGAGPTVPWLLLTAAICGGCVLALAVAWRVPGLVRAALCATVAAVMFGLSDAMSKAAFSALPNTAHFVGSWQLYGLVAAAVAAVGTSQVAFNAAPLVVSLPSLTVGEPITAVLVGVAVLGVHFRTTTAALVIEAVAAAMIVVGAWIVARSPVLSVHGLRPRTHEHEGILARHRPHRVADRQRPPAPR